MSIVDIYYIENYTGTTGNAAWVVPTIAALSSLSGIALGFLLKYWFDKKDARAKRNKMGQIFENQIEFYDELFRKQILGVTTYVKEINVNSKSNWHNVLGQRIEPVKTEDKVDLIKYFENKKKPNAIKYVNNVSSYINIAIDEVKLMEKLTNDFTSITNPYLFQYKEELRKIQAAGQKYKRYLGQNNIPVDAQLKEYDRLMKEYFGDKRLSLNRFDELKNGLHSEFLKPMFTGIGNEFYNALQDWNYDAIDIILNAKSMKDVHLFKMEVIEKNFRTIYKAIYGKEPDMTGISLS